MAGTPLVSLTLVGGDALVAQMTALGPRLTVNLTRAMHRITIDVQGAVKRDKLSGQVLKVRTGTLRRSVSSEVAVHEDTGMIEGFVGVFRGPAMLYGRLHEYGGERSYLSWRGANNTRFGTHVIAHYPERSFLRSTLAERQEVIQKALDRAVEATISSGGGSA